MDCIKNRRIAKELSEPEVLGRLQKKYPIEDGYEILPEPRIYINNTLNAKGNKAYAKPDFMVIDKKGNVVDLVDAKNGGADFTDFQKALNKNGGTFNGSSRSTQLPKGSSKSIAKNSLRKETTNYTYNDLP
ncbi:hypothetical protein KLA_15695 [Cellulophaga geojensis KL-A]|uniref:Uncharacterized protein n=1 Tax=Cellulophaga geojensis KL-A TaxID=1328323 RepID=A0ABN0RK98_9FLAO|nr:hypothetical protein [Cellulophaga geojensis]EWH11454.1 hypothetical protein KLA_15695 [Cellulophaga geojensis KL-A]